jgi:hypothetical protein
MARLDDCAVAIPIAGLCVARKVKAIVGRLRCPRSGHSGSPPRGRLGSRGLPQSCVRRARGRHRRRDARMLSSGSAGRSWGDPRNARRYWLTEIERCGRGDRDMVHRVPHWRGRRAAPRSKVMGWRPSQTLVADPAASRRRRRCHRCCRPGMSAKGSLAAGPPRASRSHTRRWGRASEP